MPVLQRRPCFIKSREYFRDKNSLRKENSEKLEGLRREIEAVRRRPIVSIVDRYTRAEADARFLKISDTGYVRFISDGSIQPVNSIAFILSGDKLNLVVKDEDGTETILHTWVS